MGNFLKTVITKKHWYDNGKKISEKIHQNPMYYICDLCNIISSQKIEDIIHSDNTEVTTNISNDIYNHTKTKEPELKNYTNLSPVDKILCWGSLFDTLLNFFRQNAYRTEPNQSKYVLVFKNEKSKQLFASFIEEAAKLVPAIYQEDYDENFGGVLLIQYPQEHKPKPKTNYFSQNYVSDEQINAIRKLQCIFRSITSFFLFVDCQNNPYDAIARFRVYIAKQKQHERP